MQDFRHFAVLIILSPKVSEQPGQNGGSSPSFVSKKSVALQKSINDIHTMSGNKTPLQKLADESILKYNPKFASPLKTASDFEVTANKESPIKVSKSKVGIFAKGFIHWKRSKDASGPNAPPAYVIVQAPSSSISFPKKLQDRVCSRLQKLSRRDYLVLGDRILRDHFNEMSERMLEPVDEKVNESNRKLTDSKAQAASTEDEYEDVEVEVEEEVANVGVPSTTTPDGPISLVLNTLKELHENQDALRSLSFRNFLALVLAAVLFLSKMVLSGPPLWLSMLILTSFFVPSNPAFDKFIADAIVMKPTSSSRY